MCEEPKKSGAVAREAQILQQLPVEYRWEFTRRHPYYLTTWRHARADFFPANEGEKEWQELCRKTLLLIGVHGDPPDPATSFKDLGPEPGSFMAGWESGAATQPTLGGFLAVLLRGLPSDARAEAAEVLRGFKESPTSPVELEVARALRGLQNAAFGSVLANVPILSINRYAPMRHIQDAVQTYLKQWNDADSIEVTRRRDDCLPDYLEVWDRREGWTGADYDIKQERSLSKISKELGGVSISTLRDRYRAAFRFIIGHDFHAGLWMRTMVAPKVYEAGILTRTAQRRIAALSRGSEVVEASPEAAPHYDTDAPLPDTTPVPSAADIADILIDVQEWREIGRSVAEIAAMLESPQEQIQKIVDYLDDRLADKL